MSLIEIYLLAINIIAFICYGLDKRKAEAGAWRIPEKTLILLAWAGGSFGALIGMYFFHHKTRKIKFNLLVPLALIVWVAVPILLARAGFFSHSIY